VRLTPGAQVLEVGPGTGIVTGHLLAAGAHVVAVEPDPSLAGFLCHAHPGADLEVVGAPLESAVLDPDRFDLAVAATSFHWVDQRRGLHKVSESLRPGAWIALWWRLFRDPDHPDAFSRCAGGKRQAGSVPQPFSMTPDRMDEFVAGSRTRLVLICGLPAAGKSTLARQLAPEIPAVRLDKDEWVARLGADVWDHEFRVRVERQLWALAQELLAHGQSVILEWGHWARVERDEKRLGARALGVGVELHFLVAPLEELIERAHRRTLSGEWTASPMTRAHFEQWATIFQPPDEEELLLFDKPTVTSRFRRPGWTG